MPPVQIGQFQQLPPAGVAHAEPRSWISLPMWRGANGHNHCLSINPSNPKAETHAYSKVVKVQLHTESSSLLLSVGGNGVDADAVLCNCSQLATNSAIINNIKYRPKITVARDTLPRSRYLHSSPWYRTARNSTRSTFRTQQMPFTCVTEASIVHNDWN